MRIYQFILSCNLYKDGKVRSTDMMEFTSDTPIIDQTKLDEMRRQLLLRNDSWTVGDINIIKT